MATYQEWNTALITHFIEGTPQGNPIYLAVDEESLTRVAAQLAEVADFDRTTAVENFCEAVRRRVVSGGNEVRIHSVQGRNREGVPLYAAFLSAMVLAASRMADEGDMSELNYFRRLRGVLGLPDEAGRPLGMRFGANSEEPLWVDWNRWLQESGFLPSAKRGEGGKTYINYALSQALLRKADRDRLARLFRDKQWVVEWDAETVSSRVRQEASHLTRQLQELLASGGQRSQAVMDAIYEEYELWREAPELTVPGTPRGTPVLICGLYRTEDPISGDCYYYLYPRQRRSQQVEGRAVQIDGGWHNLVVERPGWLMPIGPIDEAALTSGLRLPIHPAGDPPALSLPSRVFWILVPDPDNPDSDVHASWPVRPLGTSFLVLCRRELLSDLNRLRDERLIEWYGEPVPALEGNEWVEVHHCMVVSEAWQGVFPENRDLYDALRPTQSLSVGLSGGLRAPGLMGWIEGHGPRMTMFGFHEEADVRVVRVEDEHVIFDESQRLNVPLEWDWPGTGLYRVEVSSAGEETSRLVNIVSWDDLRASHAVEREGLRIGTSLIHGATITEDVGSK